MKIYIDTISDDKTAIWACRVQQCTCKFTGQVTNKLHFKATIFYNVKYLQWQTDEKSYVICTMEPFSMTWNDH